MAKHCTVEATIDGLVPAAAIRITPVLAQSICIYHDLIINTLSRTAIYPPCRRSYLPLGWLMVALSCNAFPGHYLSVHLVKAF